MPEFYYSATFDESVAILRDLCSAGFRVVLDRAYDSPTVPEYTEVQDTLIELLREGPGFYLTGEFTTTPIRMEPSKSGPSAGTYSIDALALGPIIEGMIARTNDDGAERILLLGFLSHQNEYKNMQTGGWEPAPSALKESYRRALAIMRKHLVKDNSKRFPIGPDALRLVRDGKARLQEYFGV